MEFKTLTEKTAEEVIEIFRRQLPPNAYKPVPHLPFLTNIEPSFLVEALTEAFGPVGWGWSYRIVFPIRVESVQRTKKNGETYTTNCATITDFELYYRFTLDGKDTKRSDPIPSNGSSDNTDEGFAMKGAITSALGGAAKYLQWQIDVYKGEHKPGYQSSDRPAASSKSTQKTPTEQPGLRVINFGKHKGKTLDEIAREDKSYLNYLVKSAREPEVAADALAVLDGTESAPEPEKHWIETEQNIPYFKKLNYWGVSVENAKCVLVGEGHDIREYKGTVDDALKTLKEHIDSGKPGL